MTDANKPDNDLVRQEAWPCAGPADLEIAVDLGRVRVELNDSATEVRAEVRHDPDADSPWEQGITGILTWLGNAAGDTATNPGPAAVRAAEISWTDGRLVVRSTQDLPLRVVPLVVTVWAPAGSRVTARTGAGDVTVTGKADRAAVRTGSGEIRLDEVAGAADVTTGSGRVQLGILGGDASLRTGSGGISAASLGGSTQVKTGSGDVDLGEVQGDLTVRTGSGDVLVADAHAGTFQLVTGSGALKVGVHAGVAAELDLTAGSGKARSDLEVTSTAPASAPALRITGKTGSGDIHITRAATAGV